MPDALCQPCRARGRARPATRLVPTSPGARTTHVPKCDECYERRIPIELTPLEKAIAIEASPPARPAPAAPIFPEAPLFRPAEPIPASLKPNPHPRARAGQKGFSMRSDIDWKVVQADRNAGMKLREIEKKYRVSQPTICTHTKPRPGSRFAKPAPKPANGAGKRPATGDAGEFGFGYVDLSEVPLKRQAGAVNPFWTRLAEALLACPAGKAIPFPVPAFAAKAKNPQDSIRGGITRALRLVENAPAFRFYVAVQKAQAWVWPRPPRGAELHSKGKAR
jgi:hypothetical protein